jgi:hypothetical protein
VKKLACVLTLLVACASKEADKPPVTIVTPTADDVAFVARLVDQSERLFDEVEAREEVFTRGGSQPLTPDEKAVLFSVFAPMVDQLVVLDGVRRTFGPSARAGDPGAYAVTHAALAAQLRSALAIVGRVTGRDVLETVLNEPQPEYGLPAGRLERVQRFVLDSGAFDALERTTPKLLGFYPQAREAAVAGEAPLVSLVRRSALSAGRTRQFLDKRGLKLQVLELVQDIDDALGAAMLPVVTGIATWMGDTKYARVSRPGLVTPALVDALVARMEPGDVVLERRNWYVSNVGLPGFWPHAALYTGTKDDLAAAFDAEAEVTAAYGKPFTQALAERQPRAWEAFLAKAEDGEPHRIVEAVSEGVVFASARHSMGADYVAAIRPVLSALDRARAVERAFQRFALPYDFEFDFTTDAAVVCSELVYKAYQQLEAEGPSLEFPLSLVVGRPTLPPNDMVRYFDATVVAQDAPLLFVGFVDGSEATRSATEATEAEFRQSWRRSKWDFAQE